MLKLGASLLVLAVVAGVAWFVVHEQQGESSDDPDEYFLRDVATVEAMGLPVYWLGREFTAGDLVFRGPYGAEFGAEVEGGGVRTTYLAPLDGGNVAFRLTTYSRDAWELVKERILNPKLPGVTRRTVSIRDRQAELISVPLGTRPVNTLSLVLDLGDVAIVAAAGAGAPDEPPNPLINADNLTALMEDLRPYPE